MAKLSTHIATRERMEAFALFGGALPNPDIVLRRLGKSIQAYRELLSDAHVGGCVRRRAAAIRSLESGIDEESGRTRAIKSITSILADLDTDQLISDCIDGALYGYQPIEIMWGRVGGLIVPVELLAKPPEWFVFDEQNQLRLKTTTGSWTGELLPDRKFLLPRQGASYANPYGQPDMARVFWPATFKKGGLKYWVQFVERYGTPWITGKLPRSSVRKTGMALLDNLDEMVRDAVAVIPDDSSIEIIESSGKSGSSDAHERLLMFCRSEITIALLGQNMTTESNTNRASATVGMDVADDLRDADARIVSRTMNQLIRWIWEINFSGPRPTWSMWQQEEVDDRQAKRDEILARAGVKFSKEYWKRSYDLDDSDFGEDEPAQPDEPAAFAEGESEDEEQAAIDALALAFSAGQMRDQLDPLLQPVIDAVNSGSTEDEVLAALEAAYPKMDTTKLEQAMDRLLFAAHNYGRASV